MTYLIQNRIQLQVKLAYCRKLAASHTIIAFMIEGSITALSFVFRLFNGNLCYAKDIFTCIGNRYGVMQDLETYDRDSENMCATALNLPYSNRILTHSIWVI